MKGDDPRNRNHLKINEDKGMLTLQTGGLAIQTIFDTPILEVCTYLENLEKYRLRAALSSINLKVEEFDQYYSETREKADKLYYSLLHRSLTIFHDLLLAAKFAKNEVWHEQAMLASSLRTVLYMKNEDPYNFNPSQFDNAQQEAIEALKQSLKDPEESRKTISQLTENLKEIEAQKMEDMFAGKVVNPYVAQNKEGLQLDPSSIYSSYLLYLKIKTERGQEGLIRKHFGIHEQVLKFGQAIYQQSLKAQKNAEYIIRKYADNPSQWQVTHIVAPPQLECRRQHLDADQLSLGKQVRSQSKPSLIYKNNKVEFKTYNRVLNSQTMTEELVEQIDNDERGHIDSMSNLELPPRQSPFESFTERRRVAYRDYYQYREFQKKRQDQLRYGAIRQFKEKEKVIVRRIIRTSTYPAPWAEFIELECPFFFYLQTRQQKEKTIWQPKTRYPQNDFFSQQLKKEKELSPQKKEKEKEKEKEDTQEDRQQRQSFQRKRRGEEQFRLASLRKLMKSRTYDNFLQISKMDLNADDVAVTKDEVKRYGVVLKRPLAKNSGRELDKFFYYYFKEQYYRQNEKVVDNASNPIVFLDGQKVNMDSPTKIVGQLVSSLVKRVESMPFFLVWTDDLIAFNLTSSSQSGAKEGTFDCFNFSCSSNCKKLIYEVKRRVSMKIVDKIYDCGKADSEYKQIMCKVQAGHRMIYNRHRLILDLELSARKGAAIAEEIIQNLN